MKEMELLAFVRAGESAGLEYKTSLADTTKIIETIAALATIGGGRILVGVDPKGRPVGTRLGQGERLVQRILTATDPRVYVDLEEVQTGGKAVLVISVPAGDGPHLAFGRAFYRIGPATVAMSRDEYERRLLDRMRETGGFERRVEPDWTLAQIDDRKVADFVARMRTGKPRRTEPTADTLRRLNLLREGRATAGALLLFGAEPQGPLPQATIRARAARGAATDDRAIEGTLFEQIEEAVDFVRRSLHVRTVRTQVVREEIVELPAEAIREAITNAVAHRDYRSTASIQLRLDDEGLSVWNPGHFPAPITPALLRQAHPSVPPNPLVARALFVAGYIEEWGTGTLRVIDAMRGNGNPEPTFAESPEIGGVRVVLPMPGSRAAALLPRQAKFLSDTTPGERISSAEYAAKLHIAKRTALADLQSLAQNGFVRRDGRGKASFWVRV